MDHLVGHGGDRVVVRDDDDRDPLVAIDVLKQLQDLLARGVIQGPRGLVAQEQLGLLRDGAGDRDPLLLAAGELTGEVVEPLAQPHLAQGLRGVEMIVGYLRGEFDVLQRRKAGYEVVELEDEADVGAPVHDELLVRQPRDIAAVHQHRALRGRVHAAQDVERRGLPGSRLPQHDGEPALLDMEVGVVECADRRIPGGVFLDHMIEFDIGHDRPCRRELKMVWLSRTLN